jgi:hypothetical protein
LAQIGTERHAAGPDEQGQTSPPPDHRLTG